MVGWDECEGCSIVIVIIVYLAAALRTYDRDEDEGGGEKVEPVAKGGVGGRHCVTAVGERRGVGERGDGVCNECVCVCVCVCVCMCGERELVVCVYECQCM